MGDKTEDSKETCLSNPKYFTKNKSQLQSKQRFKAISAKSYPHILMGRQIFLCNTSDKEIVIRDAYLPRFFILSSIQIQECEAVVNGKLIKPVRSDVFMTTQGYWIMNSARISEDGSSFITYERITLQSGQMHEMKMSFNCLNTFYDLTSGSNYELIFYQRNFSGDNQISEYPKPCRIKFHIGGFAHIPIEWPEISLNVSEGFSAN